MVTRAPRWNKKTLPRTLLVVGPESALREEAIAAVKAAVSEDATVNWIVMHGSGETRELTPADVLDEVCTPSMFAGPDEIKVVVVRGADKLLEKEYRELIERNLERIPDSATLVLEAASYGVIKNTNFYKSLSKQNAVIDCEALAGKYGDSNELAQDVERRAKEYGLKFSYEALQSLLARCTKDVGVIDAELKKLALQLGGKPEAAVEVSSEDVEEFCATTSTFNGFQFADALLDRDRKRALEVLGGLFSRGMSDGRSSKIVTNEGTIAIMVLAAVTYKLSQLQDVQACIDGKMQEREAFAAAKIPPFRQEAYRRTLKKHSGASLRRCMQALFRANMDLRLSGSGPQECLEKMLWAVIKS